MNDRPRVLFVCEHNAGRSQMAAGYLTALSHGAVKESDVVITMGCGDACTIFPGKRYEDWDLPDPARKDLDVVRGIRDQIRQRITALLCELPPPTAPADNRPCRPTLASTRRGRRPMQRQQIHDELDRVCADFVQLIDTSPVAEMRRPSDGTKWTNEQLLFHMLFGYLLVRNLLPLVRGFSRLPEGASRRFAGTLDAATRPFHTINYVGSLGGARALGYPGMQRLMRRVVRHLHDSLERRTDEQLEQAMHFPVGWDPYFTDVMTLREVYHYPTQHYEHHRRQLTLAATRR